ncbi:MAG TPA: hypothetical protein PLU68_02460, partial [Thermotogota bacterium]|nr:hypothetical protein [Thermotogota bacterium]
AGKASRSLAFSDARDRSVPSFLGETRRLRLGPGASFLQFLYHTDLRREIFYFFYNKQKLRTLPDYCTKIHEAFGILTLDSAV